MMKDYPNFSRKFIGVFKLETSNWPHKIVIAGYKNVHNNTTVYFWWYALVFFIDEVLKKRKKLSEVLMLNE